MAAKLLNAHLNFNGNQALSLVLENLASAPLTPIAGQLYYNTTDNEAYKYNGTSWVALGNMSEGDIKALFSAGDGITYVANSGEISADVDDSTIQVGASGIEVKDAGITLAKIADHAVVAAKINSDVAGTGLVQNGTTNALEVDLDTIGAQLAGSGLVYDATGNVINMIPTSHKETIGDGIVTSFTITHNLNSQDVLVTVLDITNGYAPVVVDSTNPTVNTCQIDVNDAPAQDQYRVIVRKF